LSISNKKLGKIRLLCFDFDGVFTDNKVITDQDGKEYVICSRSDGLGLSRIKSIGVKPIIISSEVNPVVQMRAKKLDLECFHSVKDKGEFISRFCKENNYALNQEVAFLGNDINDIPALSLVALPIGVADIFPEAEKYCEIITKLKGGNGAVREVCDLIYYHHTKN
jgi:3-deoxy-D-manno-octulosonate 8-phosphate phosphatase (KDO 8-P phosphatase)